MDTKKFHKKTKGQKLIFLQNKIKLFKIPKTICLKNNEEYSKKKHFLNCNFVAVRSSAFNEDGEFSSSAGEFVSILNIKSNSSITIKKSIDKVIASYKRKRPIHKNDEVIVQEMICKTSMSGVLFTHDLNSGAPYYVINYDDQSGLTDSVTSGTSDYSNRTLYIYRNAINNVRSKRFAILLKAVQELEKVIGSQFLDIEFVMTKNFTPYLLQVRAITTISNWNKIENKKIDYTLNTVNALVKKKFKSTKFAYGKKTILGQMPDWNPAEMIGRTPRALSISLYKKLITDHTWRKARKDMGYHVPSGQPLMLSLAGQPFIDTRLSFNSFLPNTLSAKTSEKVVNHWIDHLANSPALHDKVEFDIAITTFSFDLDKKIKKLLNNALNQSEKKNFKKKYLDLTKKLILGQNKGSIDKALNKIELLSKKQLKKKDYKLKFDYLNIPKIISDCKDLGTIPFAILARHAFIAKTILLSLKNIGILTDKQSDCFLNSIKTVASDLVKDMTAVQSAKLTKYEFMKRYGHLRPGTYDIMSKRYDQIRKINQGIFFKKSKPKNKKFKFTKVQIKRINTLLKKNNFDNFNAQDLVNYIKKSIIGREYGKFIFTRSLSKVLELIASYAKIIGLTREEISYVPINLIIKNIKNKNNKFQQKKILLKSSKQNKDKNKISAMIRLPQLLIDISNVFIVPFQVSHPNFITNKKITGKILIIINKINKYDLANKIIVVEGADPGYDWIFSQKIKGLITKYGGANSHMAIRCAEFGVPAAIGCGEQRYEKIIESNNIHLDCAAGVINIIG